MLLLRQQSPKAYQVLPIGLRIKVLTSALERSKSFNLWGLPNGSLEDASKALIECGPAAIPALERLLSETRPAPLYGSKQAMVYRMYQLRVCDYALFFIKKLRGSQNFVMPKTQKERDALINGLQLHMPVGTPATGLAGGTSR